MEAHVLRQTLSTLDVEAGLPADTVWTAVAELDDDVLRPDAPEPLVAQLVRRHLDSAVRRLVDAAVGGPEMRVGAAVEVVQIADVLALALQWQGLPWDALAVLDEDAVLEASAVLLSVVPSASAPPACPRCSDGETYAIDDFDGPACMCYPPITPAMKWLQELEELRRELQGRIASLEEQARAFCSLL